MTGAVLATETQAPADDATAAPAALADPVVVPEAPVADVVGPVPVSPAAPSGVALELTRGEDGRLLARCGGRVVSVVASHCFPWSEPGRFVSLRDDRGHEVALIADAAELPVQSRAALEQALATQAFVLEVSRVTAIRDEVEMRCWTVETRQGSRIFQTRLDEWPRTLPNGAIVIRDVAGDLYHISELARLDRASRALLWPYVD